MKYRDIATLFTDESTQIRTALRVYRCRPEIRKAIDRLLSTRAEPDETFLLAPAGNPALGCPISTRTLIRDFGLTPLDALLFLDWALRSDGDLKEAFSALLRRVQPPVERPEERPKVPAEASVEAEYARQMEELAREEAQLKTEYQQIADQEIV